MGEDSGEIAEGAIAVYVFPSDNNIQVKVMVCVAALQGGRRSGFKALGSLIAIMLERTSGWIRMTFISPWSSVSPCSASRIHSFQMQPHSTSAIVGARVLAVSPSCRRRQRSILHSSPPPGTAALGPSRLQPAPSTVPVACPVACSPRCPRWPQGLPESVRRERADITQLWALL